MSSLKKGAEEWQYHQDRTGGWYIGRGLVSRQKGTNAGVVGRGRVWGCFWAEFNREDTEKSRAFVRRWLGGVNGVGDHMDGCYCHLFKRNNKKGV